MRPTRQQHTEKCNAAALGQRAGGGEFQYAPETAKCTAFPRLVQESWRRLHFFGDSDDGAWRTVL
jgi:hypothetical protein